jgi:hypothetical protein
MKQFFLLLAAGVIVLHSLPVNAQLSHDADSVTIRKLYNEALQNGKTDSNLRYLTSRIGARISGSPQHKRSKQLIGPCAPWVNTTPTASIFSL